ncbi:MAG TPA: TetR/AcrR family transcriptional regulator [Candidatus Limnocylindrales bacterium]|nr:TetR/AcrR family transcriptional regulator [Candidatus Limnocylindrales bacterium]
MSTTREGAIGPRRQARGRRRIEAILDAAAAVFADVGYAAATTNAIADRARVSPGSLYQYFANKEAIAAALEERYAVLVRRAREDAVGTSPDASLEAAVDRLVGAVVAFGTATIGFQALFAERRMPDHLTASTHELHVALVAWVESILDMNGSRLSAGERRRTTLVSVQLCRALVPLIVAAQGSERRALAGELKRALVGYLGPVTRSTHGH